jgi:hypothetical protein
VVADFLSVLVQVFGDDQLITEAVSLLARVDSLRLGLFGDQLDDFRALVCALCAAGTG